jgi:hypothetical protein
MNDCLDEDEVLTLTGGEASTELRQRAEEHMDACETCFQLVVLMLRAP